MKHHLPTHLRECMTSSTCKLHVIEMACAAQCACDIRPLTGSKDAHRLRLLHSSLSKRIRSARTGTRLPRGAFNDSLSITSTPNSWVHFAIVTIGASTRAYTAPPKPPRALCRLSHACPTALGCARYWSVYALPTHGHSVCSRRWRRQCNPCPEPRRLPSLATADVVRTRGPA